MNLAVHEDKVLQEIRRIARDELGLTQAFDPDQELLRDLQLDSIGITTLVVGLEDRFRVVLADDDAAHVRTVIDLARLVAARTGQPPEVP